jgi:hypothetical protein
MPLGFEIVKQDLWEEYELNPSSVEKSAVTVDFKIFKNYFTSI